MGYLPKGKYENEIKKFLKIYFKKILFRKNVSKNILFQEIY